MHDVFCTLIIVSITTHQNYAKLNKQKLKNALKIELQSLQLIQ